LEIACKGSAIRLATPMTVCRQQSDQWEPRDADGQTN
jgi:hypothetical protein